jgi:hypothetical protein
MITENERDRRTTEWLIEQYGTEAVERAKTQLAGARKPYPSNIAKILGARLPESLQIASRETAQAHIAALKNIIKKRERKIS